jgi:hypothetical protein
MHTARNATIAPAIGCWLALLAIGPAAVTSAAATDDSPAADEAGTVVVADPPAAATRRVRAVFVCDDGGVPVYADRPCDSIGRHRSFAIEAPRAGTTFVTTPPLPRASTRPAPARRAPEPVPHDATAARCDALQRQLGEVNSRMRAGYSAREAARLWQRWRGLKERLHAARC